MGKYLLKRLIHGIFSIIIVVGIVMVLIFSLLDRKGIFVNDPQYTKKSGNQKIVYEYQQWEKYGYVEFDTYNDYINSLIDLGEISEEEATEAKKLGMTDADDSEIVSKWVTSFTDYYEKQGYTVERLKGKTTTSGVIIEANRQNLIAYRDLNLFVRFVNYEIYN